MSRRIDKKGADDILMVTLVVVSKNLLFFLKSRKGGIKKRSI